MPFRVRRRRLAAYAVTCPSRKLDYSEAVGLGAICVRCNGVIPHIGGKSRRLKDCKDLFVTGSDVWI